MPPRQLITQMVEAVLLDKKRILPACAYLQGEYGINGLCVGVPVKLGAGGMEQVIEIRLTAGEQAAPAKLSRQRPGAGGGDEPGPSGGVGSSHNRGAIEYPRS